MRVFLDTSAFVKRYVREQGSGKVLEICAQAGHLALSIICLPEMFSTLNRLVREGRLSDSDYRELKRMILDDLADVDICEITPEVITQTIRCLETHPLRAMDAIHLGCALAIKPDLFLSGDHRQLEAARKEGLSVIET
ncbi:MAG: type II toxin-antitoxin system VapC family toxin [Syntrophobacteraceae bacterium]